MTIPLVSRLKQFQEFLLEAGMARSVLALPAPRMLAISAPSAEGAGPANVFASMVTEPEIEAVARDLFVSGHYSLAVQQAYKAVEKFIEDKVGRLPATGTTFMDTIFSPNKPMLHWTDRVTISEMDEQRGYQRLYSGAMLGIRNPVVHEFDWIEESGVALELLVFAQHLLRKARAARVSESN
jgi:uncharacterized protein (TIGR02391 family)